jgi:hypothetical protein
MADQYDYTQMWSGVFTPPQIGDENRGVYLLDEEIVSSELNVPKNNNHVDGASAGRGGKIYDESTRGLFGGAARPKSRCAPGRLEGFHGPGGPSAADRSLYFQGSRRLGNPGPRGMVTSSREGRRAVDSVVWDNRPPHFADGTANEYAHLYIDPAARGPPLFTKNTTYPGFRQVDRFGSTPSGAGGAPPADSLEVIKLVLFVVVAVLLAMWLMVNGSEKRIAREVECALAMAAMRQELARQAGPAGP